MNMEQLASAYAIAKTLGSELSLDDFENQYSQYYEEAINEIKSRPVELAKTKVISRPF